MSVRKLQERLAKMGYPPGPIDGLMGPTTLGAINAALDTVSLTTTPPVVSLRGVVPATWMPWAKMDRVIVHWTAGTHKANATDRRPYHILVEGDGKLVKGDYPITANAAPAQAQRAHHTLNCNTGSIGVSLCCMAGAKERPFDPGKYPMTEVQWKQLILVVADLVTRYTITVLESTVLSHAEVQATLGIKQRNKWDFTRLAFDPSVVGAKAVGDKLRREVKGVLK
jgi:hypothetical protein